MKKVVASLEKGLDRTPGRWYNKEEVRRAVLETADATVKKNFWNFKKPLDKS